MNKETIERLFLSCIGSGQYLKWEIDNNINLIDYFKKINNNLFLFSKTLSSIFPKNKKQELSREITLKSVLDLLKKERIDIYNKVINHSRGQVWLRQQLRNFKETFL